MRHRKSGVKLNRTTSHRQAMFRNMVTSLFKHDRIRTTEAKAKELRRWADQVITLAKRGDLHARRQAMSIVREKDVVHKLFEEASERFGTVNGGYTRIIRIGRRLGDAAPLTLVELVRAAEKGPAKPKKSKPASTAVAPSVEDIESPATPTTEHAAPDDEDIVAEAEKGEGVDTAPVESEAGAEAEGETPDEEAKASNDTPDAEK
jgi:large subunit ribosomal protein L17